MKLKNETVSKALEILVTYAKDEDDWDLITDAVMDYYQEGYNFDLSEIFRKASREGELSKIADRVLYGKW